MAINNKLKAYVRYDGTGRVISGSLILQRSKPGVGNWQEIDANECCNSTTSTTTTAAPVYTYELASGPNGIAACGGYPAGAITYYSASSALGDGVSLYQDVALTTVVTDQYYSDGVNSWGAFSGTLFDETPC